MAIPFLSEISLLERTRQPPVGGDPWEAKMQDEDGMSEKIYRGGCLCGALRYEARGEPLATGYCFCADCKKASGSGFIPFMGFAASQLRFSGAAEQFVSKAANGGDSTRNFCAICHSLLFGGVLGQSESFTIYAGSLDDPSLFEPKMAIFDERRPHWAHVPERLRVFARMPPD